MIQWQIMPDLHKERGLLATRVRLSFVSEFMTGKRSVTRQFEQRSRSAAVARQIKTDTRIK